MADPNELKSWAKEAPSEPAANTVRVAATIPARPVHAGDWEEVVLRATKPSWAWPVLAVVSIAMLVGVAGGLGWQRLRAPTYSASSEAKVVVVGDGVTLSLGRLEVASHRKVKLVTPHLELMLTGKVAADVDVNRTQIEVYEGTAEVRAEGVRVELHAGETRQWPSAPKIPESLRELQPPPGACDERPVAERDACLVEESSGDGLGAQVALVQRAGLASTRAQVNGAEVLWRESLRRFPRGVLHPEVRLSLLRQLIDERRFDSAANEALEFELACPDDPRVADVRRLRLGLEARRR